MDFVVKLTDLETRVVECVGSLIENEGFELVKIKANSEAGHGHLAFYMDRNNREKAITMDDLEFLNGLISDVLDVADAEKPFFKLSYNLEVSSPGVERPLTKKAHFVAAVGKNLRVRTDGLESLPRSVTGSLIDVSDEGIRVESAQTEEITFVPYVRIRDAYEVFDFGALDSKKIKKGVAKKSKGDK